MQRKSWANILLALSSLGVTLFVCEAGVRWLDVTPEREMNDFRPLADGYYEKHNMLGWVPRKNISGIHTNSEGRVTSFKTNSRGLRDREYALTKPAGVTRIVILGDSFTWGWGVDDNKSYVEILESLLKNTEVLNLGVTAFQTQQEFEYLKLEGMGHNPDIVIIGFCLNDIFRSDFPQRQMQNGAPRTSQREHDGLLFFMKRQLHAHSALYKFVLARVNTNKTLVRGLVRAGLKDDLAGFDDLNVNLMPALRTYPEALEVAFEKTRSTLLEMHSYLAQRNIRLIVALIPSLETVDDMAFQQSIAYSVFDEMDFDREKPYKLLETFCKDHGIEVFNPVAAFKARHGASKKLFLTRDMHFNEEGHRLFATELFQYLAGSTGAGQSRAHERISGNA